MMTIKMSDLRKMGATERRKTLQKLAKKAMEPGDAQNLIDLVFEHQAETYEALEQRDQALHFQEKAEKERDACLEVVKIVSEMCEWSHPDWAPELRAALAKVTSIKRDHFAVQVDPNRPVSEGFIETLRNSGASESFIRSIELENERKSAKVNQ